MLIYDQEGLGPSNPVCSEILALGLFLAKTFGTNFQGAIVKGRDRLIVIAPLDNGWWCRETPLRVKEWGY